MLNASEKGSNSNYYYLLSFQKREKLPNKGNSAQKKIR